MQKPQRTAFLDFCKMDFASTHSYFEDVFVRFITFKLFLKKNKTQREISSKMSL